MRRRDRRLSDATRKKVDKTTESGQSTQPSSQSLDETRRRSASLEVTTKKPSPDIGPFLKASKRLRTQCQADLKPVVAEVHDQLFSMVGLKLPIAEASRANVLVEEVRLLCRQLGRHLLLNKDMVVFGCSPQSEHMAFNFYLAGATPSKSAGNFTQWPLLKTQTIADCFAPRRKVVEGDPNDALLQPIAALRERASEILAERIPAIDKCLASLERFQFSRDDVDDAKQVCTEVRMLMVQTGCETMLEGVPGSVSAFPRRPSCEICVDTVGHSPQTRLYARVAFPRLAAKSVSEVWHVDEA